MLGDKPEIQEKIKEEAEAVLGDDISYEKISKLKYTEVRGFFQVETQVEGCN
jgi:hypothetical protein